MKKCYIEWSALYHCTHRQVGHGRGHFLGKDYIYLRQYFSFLHSILYLFSYFGRELLRFAWHLALSIFHHSFLPDPRAIYYHCQNISYREREYIFWKEKKTEDKIESLESVNNFWNLFLIINVNFMKETVSRDLYALNFFLSHYTNPFGSLFDKYFAKIFNAKVRIFYSSMSLSTWSEKFRLR